MNRHSDSWIDQATVDICTRCPLEDCEGITLSPYHQQKIRELETAPRCPVFYPIFFHVPLYDAAEIAKRVLDPDKPGCLLTYQQEITHARANN
jgi:hypothetical protein